MQIIYDGDYVYKTIHPYFLQGETYIRLKPIITLETATSPIFPDLSFRLGEVFED
ncbi:MAG: hypothetical protein ACJAYY_000204 [Paraglaciecola sp.]|jgi:hypothetical protein|uniref:hypothetical protein n=1 Tax=Polaribacter sp. TaxID=1920175 RepID=UPI003AD22F9A